MNILVVGAHPDDEVLGAGGAIAKHVASGDHVYVCIVTQAFAPQWSEDYLVKKTKEQEAVDVFLGITKRFQLGHHTTKLNTVPHGEISGQVCQLVKKVSADILYTHFEDDVHYDNTVTYRACLVASRPPNSCKLICYETVSETEWGSRPFHPNYWIDIEQWIDKKIQACSLYQTEMRQFPHPRSDEGIRTLAKFRGMQMCRQYGEAFQIIRDAA